MSSLMDSLGNSISPDLIASLAGRFNLPEDAIVSALQASSAATLTTLASRTNEAQYLSSVYEELTRSTLASTENFPEQSGPVSLFVHGLFGNHLQAVESEVARTTKVPVEAADASLWSVAPFVMSVLSDRITGGELTLPAFASTLTTQLPQLRSFLPEGFAVMGTPGLTVPEAAPSARLASREVDQSSMSAGWLWPVLVFGAILIVALIWYFARSQQLVPPASSDTTAQTPSAMSDTAPTVANPAPPRGISALGPFIDRKLPTGVELNIPENGIEKKLIVFIEDPSGPVDVNTWFDFDRLLFATGSDRLDPSSNEQLENVAAIMKAYPNVHLRIGGYTDNTGNAAANVKLSQNRASNVRAAIVALGVDPDRLDARGYGEEHPIADNSTEAGRAQNRRISVRVTQK